ncbi:hypothetical protein D9619_003618 [Psilocybe cf. subviscida]|uniref:Pyridoxamine 5'-phosphate oxidase N-terminal domain-containing protein n=1 Tax=Psilocybe cf. subviscida TaxID=2480587 RepID=A0A8H5AXD7_9AGAR|nr:hypothetical protein D9619_003618 [Psilocybe cf. subviscida]
MGKFFDEIPPHIVSWIQRQKMFWVATAPMTADGHVNVSPKGYAGTFHIVDSKKVWYEDMSGSGVETIAHIRENGRMTIMFCAFEGAPQIVRLFGTGTVYEVDTPEYNAMIPVEKRIEGSRSVIMLDIYKVSSSCGYGVPYYTYKAPRKTLRSFLGKMEGEDLKAAASTGTPHDEMTWPEKGIRALWKTSNLTSLDGLPGLQSALGSAPVFVDREGASELEELSDGGYNSRRWGERWNALLDTRFIAGATVGVAASIISTRLLATP